jgi:hypothetical protein
MFKYSLALLAFVCLTLSSFKDGDKPSSDKVTNKGVNGRFYFPVLLTESRESSFNAFADAAELFYSSQLSRQAYLEKLFLSDKETFTKVLLGEEVVSSVDNQTYTIRTVNAGFIRFLVNQGRTQAKGQLNPLIDSLLFHDAFLGLDLADDLARAQVKKISASTGDVGLPSVISSRPTFDANRAKSTDGAEGPGRSREMKALYVAKLEAKDAILIDAQYSAPVFLDPNLLGDGTGDIELRVYELALRWMIFANAYPTQYSKVSPKVIDYIRVNDWTGLFYFCREYLNPADHQELIQKHLRINLL